jgi:GH24 family phage-related lysozyme (muramidase)
MLLSPAGLSLIAGFEGCVLKPYNDSRGFATIGFGHLLHASHVTEADTVRNYVAAFGLTGVSTHGALTREQALELLDKDTAYYAAAVSRDIKVRLGLIPSRAQARFDALVSLCFNIGVSGFGTSSLARLINTKGAPRDWSVCGPAWLAWSDPPELLPRRKAELAIFASGKYPKA